MVGWKTRCLRTFGGGDGGARCYGGHRNCIFAVNGGHYQNTLVGYYKQKADLMDSLTYNYNTLLSYYLYPFDILSLCLTFHMTNRKSDDESSLE